MPALSIATSDPREIAIPTFAAANAGLSLTPSPTIATISPLLLRRINFLVITGGKPAVDRSYFSFDLETLQHRLHESRSEYSSELVF